MRVPWFNWLSSRGDETSKTVLCAPQRRTDVDIDLALCLIPHYVVVLQIGNSLTSAPLSWPIHWLKTLTQTLGPERAQRALRDLRECGYAKLAVCPRESAEHYRDELARLDLPCHISLA